MAKHLEGTLFVTVNSHAKSLADAAICAYWSDCTDDKYYLPHHQQQIRDSLNDICEIMGLRVVDAADAPATEDAA